jgi:hypothetical protein
MMVTLCPDISTTDTDDGMVLLNERTGQYFQLNPSGALVLTALVNGMQIQQAARLLTHRYAITHERTVTDIGLLIGHLRRAGLITS